jgi:dihydrolipoamide dehydrogenase
VHVELESLSTGARRVETYDRVLVGVGRVPNSEDLGLEELGVRRDGRRFIEVNWHLETNRPNLYAVGDVTGDPMFAHKAMRQGLVAAERCAGRTSAMDAVAVPGYVYTIPEVAWVGPTEQELRADGASLRVGRLPLGASARAVTSGAEDGFVKVIADAATDLVLAVHACAPNAGDVIGEAALAIEMGAVVDDIAQTVHPHPTLSELLLECAEAVRGRAIHYPALNITAERKKAAQARESIPRRAGAG